MAGAGDLDCIRLVFVEAQRLSLPRALHSLLLLAEYPAAFRVQGAIIDQLVNPCPGFERRVELDQRLWPQQSCREFLFDLLVDPPVLDVKETSDEIPIVRNQPFAEFEHIHALPSPAMLRPYLILCLLLFSAMWRQKLIPKTPYPADQSPGRDLCGACRCQ